MMDTPDAIEEIDALRYEVRQLRRTLAELNLKHEALLLDIETKTIAGKYSLGEGDAVDIGARTITRNRSKAIGVYQAP